MMKFKLSCLALSALLFVPPQTGFAQQGCTGQVCGMDSNAEIKAKRKGGYREGRSPEEVAALNESIYAQEAYAEEAVEPVEYPPVVQDYEPNPAIWKLSDEDTTIYLFGTFHILPADFKWRSDAFNAIVAEADELVVETSDDDSAESLDVIMTAMFAEVFSEDRITISSRLAEENRAKWFKLAELTGMPEPMFDRMPLFLSMMGAGLSISEQAGSKSEYGVETVLEAEFKASGKPIGSIEDSGSVMNALINLDEAKLIKDLDEDLRAWDGESLDTLFAEDPKAEAPDSERTEPPAEVDPFASEHSWAKGTLEEMTEDEFGDSEVGKEIYRILLIDRNRAWAEWLDDRLDRPGTILLAVGAAHFEGPHSVHAMLAERDLAATRLH